MPKGEVAEEAFQLEDRFIERIHGFIQQHLSDHTLDVGKICAAIGVSRSNLHRKITALTGMSTSLYIRRYRLLQARNLLQHSDLHVAGVAYEVGFSDPAYFSRTFAKEFGVSPKALREQDKP